MKASGCQQLLEEGKQRTAVKDRSCGRACCARALVVCGPQTQRDLVGRSALLRFVVCSLVASSNTSKTSNNRTSNNRTSNNDTRIHVADGAPEKTFSRKKQKDGKTRLDEFRQRGKTTKMTATESRIVCRPIPVQMVYFVHRRNYRETCIPLYRVFGDQNKQNGFGDFRKRGCALRTP